MKISNFAKRFLIMIMCGFLFTGSLAVPVMADEAELTDALGVTPDTDGDINASDQGNIHEDAQKNVSGSAEGTDLEVNAWSQLQEDINEGGTVVLTQDIVASDSDTALTVPSGKSVVLYLNRHTINRSLSGAVENGSVIINNGDLTITGGGKITGGYTTGNGGGVLNNGSLTIETAAVSGNAANGNGGGVYSGGSSKLYIQGTPIITGNTAGEKEGNLYITSNVMVEAKGKLTENAKIGISAEGSLPRLFTRKLDENGSPSVFTSEREGAEVRGFSYYGTQAALYQANRLNINIRGEGEVQTDREYYINGDTVNATVKAADKWEVESVKFGYTPLTLDESGACTFTFANNSSLNVAFKMQPAEYIDSDGNYQPLTGGSLTATIHAAQAPNPSILTDEQKPHAVADLTYDGQSHELVSAPTGTLPNNYEKVMYSTDGGTTWSDAIPAKTSADDYTVNYKYVDTDGAYADLIVPDSIPVSIAPAPAPDVDTLPDDQKPAAIDGLEYTGSAQDLIDSDTPATLPDGYDQIWYSTDGGSTWSQNIPTGTDAGEYEILYKYVDADGDHEDITGGSVTVSIAPADAPSADSLTDANKPSAVDYEVSVKYVDSNGNHDDLTGVTVPVTIAPAEAPDASSLTAAQKPTAVNGLAYTGSEQELVNAPSSLPAGYDEVWYSTDGGNTWSQDIPTGIEAGNYTVSVKYVDTDGNYEDLTGITVPVTIAQEAAPELTDAQKPSAVSGLTYTGSAQALVSAPASLPDGYEQVWYSLDGGNTWTQTIPTGTDAGTYTISVRYVDTDGIKADILGSDITVTIAAGTTTAVINGVAQTVTIGSTLARPEDPTRYGYDFTGWFADEACTIPYNFNTPVGVNGVTLYAGWAQVSYSLTEGGESTWNGNSDSTLTFRAVRNRLEPMTFSHFTGIRVDGKDVSKDNYQAKSGSVIVTLNESYLKTLSAGEHTLDIMFDDAPSVRTTFTIVAAQVPSTGESAYSAYSILGALLIASAAAFVIFSARHEEA